MDVPSNFLINDIRKTEDFRKKTFSGYSRKDVFDIFFKSLDENKLEESCQWCVEIVISGYYEDLWDRLINYISKYIGVHNPLLPYTLFLRIVKFLKLKKIDVYKNNYLELRNSQEVRNLFCELVCIIIMSTKTRKPNNLVKITPTEFLLEGFQKRLLAKTFDGAEKFVMADDPNELRIIINEFFYNIEESRFKLNNLVYWLSWALEWEKNIQKKKGELICSIRDISGIDKKYCRDFIWIIWEVILYETNNKNNEILTKQIRSLYEFFKMKFTESKKRKRINLILNALDLLSIQMNYDFVEKNPIIDRYHILIQACGNINLLYKEKKVNENFTSDAVNSKIKLEATYVVTKYQDLSMLEDFPNKKKPKYLKSKENPRDLTPKEKEKKNLEEISQGKQDMVSQIDTLILGSGKSTVAKIPIRVTDTINEESNKTVSLISEIEEKLNKKKKKKKIINVMVNKNN
uniref:Uncharacterized protein n=1 Tax=viral metagenome TaxID=1070528 RepID=A0A6C0J680_9ZZZZ